MDKKRVVLTGMGAITPLGNSVSDFWENIIKGKSGVEKLDTFDTEGLRVQIGAEVKNFDPKEELGKKAPRRMDRVCQLGVVAAREAINDSEIDDDSISSERVGVVTGSGIGGISTLEEQHSRLLNKKARYVSPLFIPMMIPDIIPGHISMKWDFEGPNYSIASACASASHAIGNAYNHIISGEADVMVTGGAEASITPLALAGFTNMQALSKRNDEPKKASRPFDKERDGFVMGEGAGMVVLEELEHAKERGANIYAEVSGFGFSADAHHITAPHPDGRGAVQSMKKAVQRSGIDKDDFQYINAHGTSTPANDPMETKAIKNLFGDKAYDLNISSTKSMTGHLLGATGGIEFIALAKTIIENIIPPTINYEHEDPECDLNYTPNEALEKEVKAGLSNNFGFGGHNASIAVTKFEE